MPAPKSSAVPGLQEELLPTLEQLKSVMSNVIVSISQLSKELLSIISGVIEALPDASNRTVMSFAIAIGASLSFTLTIKVFVEVPIAFVAVAVTVAEPIVNKEPDGIS